MHVIIFTNIVNGDIFPNLFFYGPPGTGKSMLASRLPSILPKLTSSEILEISMVASIAGKITQGCLTNERPFRAPHHSCSIAAMVGGGVGRKVKPGEISLAHNGVLFLDELPEFQRHVLELLRQPLEERKIPISRAHGTVEFPANFLLISAMNPCPCGYFHHPEKPCTCKPFQVERYLHRISGPLLDRIDIHIEVTPVPFEKLSDDRKSECSIDIRKRVTAAREIQTSRFELMEKVHYNAQMSSKQIREFCALDEVSKQLLKTAMERLNLSARAYDRILKVARTIADLAASDDIKVEHLAEAIQYRSLDRESWGAG